LNLNLEENASYLKVIIKTKHIIQGKKKKKKYRHYGISCGHTGTIETLLGPLLYLYGICCSTPEELNGNDQRAIS